MPSYNFYSGFIAALSQGAMMATRLFVGPSPVVCRVSVLPLATNFVRPFTKSRDHHILEIDKRAPFREPDDSSSAEQNS